MLLCLAAWAVPGAGHLWLGRRSKGIVFLLALPLMFAIGLGVHGRLFPFDMTEPLVGLAAFANLGIGVPYFRPIVCAIITVCANQLARPSSPCTVSWSPARKRLS